jgi:hypothetical protein
MSYLDNEFGSAFMNFIAANAYVLLDGLLLEVKNHGESRKG